MNPDHWEYPLYAKDLALIWKCYREGRITNEDVLKILPLVEKTIKAPPSKRTSAYCAGFILMFNKCLTEGVDPRDMPRLIRKQRYGHR